MGPTNIALVKLFQADQELHNARSRLDSASRNVRLQERRLADLREQLALAQSNLREFQSQAAQLELDIKTRDERINRLRTQQQTAHTAREYQTFLTEINAEKIDRAKVEDETLKAMSVVEKQQQEIATLQAQIQADQEKLDAIKTQLAGRLAELQAEIDRLQPIRDAAAAEVPGKALDTYERVADRFESEAMAPIAKPNPRYEEYICDACNMSLVAETYNRLHSRDEPVICPSCRRLLFIPADLPPELALNTKKKPEGE